jgi:protease secretion system outer membrane protein
LHALSKNKPYPKMKISNQLTLIITFLVCAGLHSAEAADLLADYQRARHTDAVFSAAKADYETGRIQSQMAGAAYYPQATLSQTQLPNEDSDRQTITVSQPVVNVDRWLSLQEKNPRSAMAETVLVKSQYDLALRLLKVVSALSESREKLLLNKSALEALQAQMASAQRAYELGRGTITDVYDSKVRLAQARSQTLTFQSALQAAQRQYENMVGEPPQPASYTLNKAGVELKMPSLQEFMNQARRGNPNIRARELASTVGDITRKRVRAVFLPSINATVQRSSLNGTSTTSSGIALRLDLPLDMTSYLKLKTSDLDQQKLLDQERDTKEQVILDIQRLYSEVQSSMSEVAIRRDAIAAAEQSVSANEQSFTGGVRTKIDVLNALQSLPETESDYITTLLQLGERLLNLQVSSAVNIELALQQVQAQLFQY